MDGAMLDEPAVLVGAVAERWVASASRRGRSSPSALVPLNWNRSMLVDQVVGQLARVDQLGEGLSGVERADDDESA